MNFTVYKSSAGSGKTFTLVSEYISLVLTDPAKYRQILAITFTNKAANEMKMRIVETLKEIAKPDANMEAASIKIILPAMVESTGFTEKKLIENAKLVIKLILHHYADFAVSTIDSFMHKVIRSFAFDLGIPVNFEVEMDEKNLLVKMVDVLISRAGTEEKLTKFLVEFTRSKANSDKSWNIEQDIFRIAQLLQKEEASKYLDKLKEISLDEFAKIIRILNKWIAAFEKFVTEKGRLALEIIDSVNLNATDFYRGNSGIPKYFEYIANGRFDKTEPNTYVYTTINENKWASPKTKEPEQAAIETIKPELHNIFAELQKYFEDHLSQYILYSDLLKNIYPLAIINEIEKILTDYKHENSVLLISEFNKKIAEIVLNEPVPFIYERVGEKYRHFLIDEFQDTSFLQWQNLLPLIENALAQNNYNMIVGDGKQAIYRWRNGEVEQFARLPKVFGGGDEPFQKQREEILKRNYRERVLDKNFRSCPNIIDFNNRFFSLVRSYLEEPYRSLYDDVSQSPGSDRQGGFVQLDLFKRNDETDFFDFNLEKILTIIRDLLDRGYRLKDIAVLCRSNDNASEVAGCLLSEGISVVSSESLLLSNSAKVRLIISSIRVLINPADKVAITEVIHWLWQTGRITDFHDALKRTVLPGDRIDHLQQIFLSYLEKLDIRLSPQYLLSLPVYDFCEELIRIFHLSDKADPYLQFFLDAVLDQTKDSAFGLPEVIDWWEESGDSLSIVVPEGSDSIQVMTIHKAKGLEFPVVIYPFANNRVRKTKDLLWVEMENKSPAGLPVALISTSGLMEKTIFREKVNEEASKSLLDLVNILYVVMTRPTNELYVISEMPPARRGEGISLPVLFGDFLNEENLKNVEGQTWIFGEKMFRSKSETTDLSKFTIGTWISNSWNNRIRVSTQASGHWNTSEGEHKRKWGILIHRMLSAIRSVEDMHALLEDFSSQGIITSEEKEIIRQEIFEILTDPAIKPYFRKGLEIKTEPEVILPGGKLYRPDRIIFEPDSTTVIDFKTGKFSRSHEEQVIQYMDILKQMSYPGVSGILLYLYEDEKVRYVT